MGRPEESRAARHADHGSEHGFKLLRDVLEDCVLPLTIKMESSQHLLGKDNGLFTLQHKRTIIQIEYLSPNGNTRFLSANPSDTITAVNLDNSTIYRTIEGLRASRKTEKIRWFVSSKGFTVDRCDFHIGQIFSFAPTSLLRSFRRGKKRGIYVLIYPLMTKLFIPMDTEGNFCKCESPLDSKTYILSEFTTRKDFPCLLSLKSNEDPLSGRKKSAEIYYALNISSIDILYASKKGRVSLHIHAFSATMPLSIQLKPNTKPVDVLDVKELNLMLQSITLPLDTDLTNFYTVHTYKELGLIRLLEEIIIELTDRVAKSARFNSERRSHFQKTRDDIKKQLSFNGNLSSKQECILSSHKGAVSNHLRKAYDRHTYCSDQLRHIYSNDDKAVTKIYTKDTKDRNEQDMVELDDGGYVVVPSLRRTPKKRSESFFYRSSDNVGYNYQLGSSHEFDNHIYAYINPVILDSMKGSAKSGHFEGDSCVWNRKDGDVDINTILCNGQSCFPTANGETFEDLKDNVYNIDYGKSAGKKEKRHSAVYDYTHIGRVCSTDEERINEIKDLESEEVVDLLKVVKMKKHIETFRENSIDGRKLLELSEVEFLNLDLTKFEAKKIECFVNGWRPLKKSLGDESWLSQMVCYWSVDDVCSYLLHIDMHFLQAFCRCQDVDGYLLKKIIDDNIIDSLSEQHDVKMKESSVRKLKTFITEDEKPKFLFLNS